MTTSRIGPSFFFCVVFQLLEDERLDHLGRKTFAVEGLRIDRVTHIPLDELCDPLRFEGSGVERLLADHHQVLFK